MVKVVIDPFGRLTIVAVPRDAWTVFIMVMSLDDTVILIDAPEVGSIFTKTREALKRKNIWGRMFPVAAFCPADVTIGTPLSEKPDCHAPAHDWGLPAAVVALQKEGV